MRAKGWAQLAAVGLAFGVLTSVLNHAGEAGAIGPEGSGGLVGAIAAVVGGGALWACVLIAAAWWVTRDEARAVVSGDRAGGAPDSLWVRGIAASVGIALVAVIGYYLSDLGYAWANLRSSTGPSPDGVETTLGSLVRDTVVETGYWVVGALITGIPLGVVGVLTHGRSCVSTLARLVAPLGLTVWGGQMVMTERALQPDPWRVAAFGLTAVVGLALLARVSLRDPEGR